MTHTSVYSRTGSAFCEDSWPTRTPSPGVDAPRRARRGSGGAGRPSPARPAAIAPRYRGTGVRVSRAPHARTPGRRITPWTLVGLAFTAALVTMWLGVVAQFGEAAHASSPVPDRLAVVQVRSGETLAHLAARVAPDAPVNSVVDRIRELNELEAGTLDAGQTLIAPVG
ncbi:LysM peptidoglycan-binding domain-containing protein [Mycobacterium sp. ACS4331]|uniref:LysM peptidoglycan-binding domain-containing protein n=1 Tax=Mycobacterium sp. ACS4331 TaxID=1834121 RepID=UPI0009EE247E|nr:LysM peptidoglycan-binding domain-containing protein [Mycobacterium sp. ACS4331]